MAVWQAKRTDHKTECHHKYTLHIFHGWAVCHVSICMLQNCSECTHIIISVQFAKTVVLPRCRLCRFVLFFLLFSWSWKREKWDKQPTKLTELYRTNTCTAHTTIQIRPTIQRDTIFARSQEYVGNMYWLRMRWQMKIIHQPHTRFIYTNEMREKKTTKRR